MNRNKRWGIPRHRFPCHYFKDISICMVLFPPGMTALMIQIYTFLHFQTIFQRVQSRFNVISSCFANQSLHISDVCSNSIANSGVFYRNIALTEIQETRLYHSADKNQMCILKICLCSAWIIVHFYPHKWFPLPL